MKVCGSVTARSESCVAWVWRRGGVEVTLDELRAGWGPLEYAWAREHPGSAQMGQVQNLWGGGDFMDSSVLGLQTPWIDSWTWIACGTEAWWADSTLKPLPTAGTERLVRRARNAVGGGDSGDTCQIRTHTHTHAQLYITASGSRERVSASLRADVCFCFHIAFLHACYSRHLTEENCSAHSYVEPDRKEFGVSIAEVWS